MIPSKTFDVAQIQETQAESPVAMIVCQAYQPVGNLTVL
jgi:hypothetical protein